MRIQEILIIDELTKEVIVQLPFNENQNPTVLKKGYEIKVSYDKPFKTKNIDGKLILNEKVKKTMSDLKEKLKK